MPKNKEAFVESPPEVEGGARRAQRVSLKVNEEGVIDWGSMSEKQKENFATLVANDPTALELIGLKAGEGENPEGEGGFYVKPEHVAMALDGYSKVTGFLIPKIILKKSKGLLRITPEMASEAFTFSDKEKADLSEPGAQWANEVIPETWRKWIMENAGPGVQFFGMLAMITAAQTQNACKMAAAALKLQEDVVSVQSATSENVQ